MKDNYGKEEKRKISKSPSQSGINGEYSKPKFSQEQLDKALLDSFDLMRRVLLQDIYLVIGEAAKCIKEDRGLDCDSLEFAIEKRYISKEILSTIKDWVLTNIDDRGFSYLFEGVPVKFKFIKRKYNFFKNPDVRPYGPEFYKIPNPFETYWKSKGFIQ